VADAQETPERLLRADVVSGLGAITHAPFRRVSTSVRSLVPETSAAEPTALQAPPEGQETAVKESTTKGEGAIGLGVTRHLPFARVWTSVAWKLRLPSWPTAIQEREEGHETPKIMLSKGGSGMARPSTMCHAEVIATRGPAVRSNGMHIKVTDRNIVVVDQAVLWAARVRGKVGLYFVVRQPAARTGVTATNGKKKQSTCPKGVPLVPALVVATVILRVHFPKLPRRRSGEGRKPG
jgi:hypothetical protein